MSKRDWFFFVGILFFTNLAMIFSQVEEHERIHQSIYDHYNIDSTIEYHPLNAFTFNGDIAYTTPNQTQYYERCNDMCRSLQAQNEIVGYNNYNLMQVIIMVALALGFMIYRGNQI